MENIEVLYQNLKVGDLYVYLNRDDRSNKIILLYLENVLQGYIIPNTPFMVIDTSSAEQPESYKVMWTDSNGETVMGWTKCQEIVFDDFMFLTACEANTVEYSQELLHLCESQYTREKILSSIF